MGTRLVCDDCAAVVTVVKGPPLHTTGRNGSNGGLKWINGTDMKSDCTTIPSPTSLTPLRAYKDRPPSPIGIPPAAQTPPTPLPSPPDLSSLPTGASRIPRASKYCEGSSHITLMSTDHLRRDKRTRFFAAPPKLFLHKQQLPSPTPIIHHPSSIIYRHQHQAELPTSTLHDKDAAR